MFFQLKAIQNPINPLAPRKPRVSFMGDERGGITIFVIVISIFLLVAGGMAVDFERHELARADLQDALDRGVLAATNSRVAYDTSGLVSVDDQAKALIYQYISARSDQTQVSGFSVTVTDTPGGRAISATADHPLNTIFLGMMGLGTMNVAVTSGAVQAASKLEITLVLDVSGSMGNDSTSAPGTKLAQLKVAAKQFLDIVLENDNDADLGNDNRTLISIVPFSQQVALPAAMADLYNFDRQHSYSSCFDYHGLDFDTVEMPTNSFTPFEQGQHFIEKNAGSSSVRYGCPLAVNTLTPYSNNLTQLTTAIDALTDESWTTTYVGVKWAAALLDTTSRPVVSAMIANNQLSADFAGWPHAWNDPSVRKITVVMTDGKNTRLNEVTDSVYAQQTPDYWHTNSPGGGKYSVINNDGSKSFDTDPDGTVVERGDGDRVLKRICDQVKAAPLTNATIYTIGFELAGEDLAINALKNCASDEATTYYEVDGADLTTVFRNIANEIVKLKLTN